MRWLVKIKLNFNHPCKELIWVVQPDANVDYCSSLDAAGVLFRTLGAQPFNYTDAIDALPPSIAAFGGPNETTVSGSSEGFINASGLFELPGAVDGSVGAAGWAGNEAPATNYLPFAQQSNLNSNGGSLVSDAGTFVLSETALDMHCWGENPVVTAKLQLNGQPYQHHTRHPDTGINVYSFALRPEEHQPSGSCNFSRIDNAVLQLVLSAPTVAGTATAKVRVYAVNYNVLRVMSGMAGVAYSN